MITAPTRPVTTSLSMVANEGGGVLDFVGDEGEDAPSCPMGAPHLLQKFFPGPISFPQD